MRSSTRNIVLIAAVVVIIAAIAFFEKGTVRPTGESGGSLTPLTMGTEDKAKKYEPAKEVTTPDAFINTDPITIEGLIGEKVVLVDFWTYSCINCQRTIPYLNAWWEQYEDEGLVILGIHTPEFEFEKEYDNVLAAVEKFDIKYPVVMDNDYSTWRAYKNRYWPRKYLIDIDGYIIYDHIGEGGYDETEDIIRAALAERAERLGEQVSLDEMATPEGVIDVDFSKVKSPEIYFGSGRNEHLANGQRFRAGSQDLSAPSKIELNELYLTGKWDFEEESVENSESGARIIFRYKAMNVYLVASAIEGAKARILLDGELITDAAGGHVENGTVLFDKEQLYHLVGDADYNEHTLEIILEDPGLKAFAFTFG